MSVVYSTLSKDKNEKVIKDAIERDIESSKENASHTFTPAAKNSFAPLKNKSTKKDIKKASGPSARQ